MENEVIYLKPPSKDGYFDPIDASKGISEKTMYVLTLNKKYLSGTFIPISTNFVFRNILTSLSSQYKALKFVDNYITGNIIRVVKPGTIYFSNEKWLITTSCLVQVEFELESVRQDFFEEKFLEINCSLNAIKKIESDLKLFQKKDDFDSFKIFLNERIEMLIDNIDKNNIEHKSLKKKRKILEDKIDFTLNSYKEIEMKIIKILDSHAKKSSDKIYLGKNK